MILKKCFEYLFKTKQKISLHEFKEISFAFDDTWNKIPKSDIWKCYFKKNFNFNEINLNITTQTEFENICEKSIGYINYRTGTGQIGYFFINENYRNKSLGKQILLNAILDMKNNKIVWTIASHNHPFWSNVFNKSFKYSERPHMSVTGSGYLLHL